MFRSGSPYSPFFMSGLLPSHSANASDNVEDEYLYEVDFRRRGSLPDTSTPVQTSSPTSSVAQFYKERSFLSLDLAGAGSLRAPSLHTIRSRPSLQNLPSQKPIPKYADALPALPSADARASSFLLPSSAIAGPSKSDIPALKRNVSTASTVSTNYRRTKRSDALARLEGRAQVALASFKFGDIKEKEEQSSTFMSMSDDEDSSQDEWDVDSSDDADYVDLAIDFSSTHRHSYSSPSQRDDEEDILPLSHTYSRSFSTSTSPSAQTRAQLRRTKSRSNSSYGLRPSAVKSGARARGKVMSMFPDTSSSMKYTSFIDLERSSHRERPVSSSSSSMIRPSFKRFSSSSSAGQSAPVLNLKPRKEEWLKWSSFIEISAVV